MAAPTSILSLCSGCGALDLAIRSAIADAQTVCYVEREASSVAQLVARMQERSLDDAPVWSDLTTFDGRAWRGLVDGVIGGWPCQDISCAGPRTGLSGKRSGLWYHVRRVIEEVKPSWCFFENVSAILSANGRNMAFGSDSFMERAIGTVLRDLAELGFNAEWCVLRASDVGAPHQRARWWCLAYADGIRRIQHQSIPASESEDMWSGWQPGRIGKPLSELPDANGFDLRNESESITRSSDQAIIGDLVPLFPPRRTDWTGWRRVLERWPWLRPAVVEGADECARDETSQPVFRRLDDGSPVALGLARAHRIRSSGNAVVPLAAATAFRLLARRLT